MDVIKLNDNPTAEQLSTFWQSFATDPIRRGTYMDSMPDEIGVFLEPIHRDAMRLWVILVDDQVAGASWVHDIQSYNQSKSGWMASYYLSHFRGKLAKEALIAANQAARDDGIPHLFAGARQTNVIAQRFAEGAGYHRIGVVEAFGWFEGKLDALTLFTLNPLDSAEAWQQAEARADLHRRNPPVDIEALAGPVDQEERKI